MAHEKLLEFPRIYYFFLSLMSRQMNFFEVTESPFPHVSFYLIVINFYDCFTQTFVHASVTKYLPICEFCCWTSNEGAWCCQMTVGNASFFNTNLNKKKAYNEFSVFSFITLFFLLYVDPHRYAFYFLFFSLNLINLYLCTRV